MEQYPPSNFHQNTMEFGPPPASAAATTKPGSWDFHYLQTKGLNNFSAWAPYSDYYRMNYINGTTANGDSGFLQTGSANSLASHNADDLQRKFPLCSISSSQTSSNCQMIQEICLSSKSQEPLKEPEAMITKFGVRNKEKPSVPCTPLRVPLLWSKFNRVGYHKLYDVTLIKGEAVQSNYSCLVINCNHEAQSLQNIRTHIFDTHIKSGTATSLICTTAHEVYKTGRYRYSCGFKWCEKSYLSSKCLYVHILSKHVNKGYTCPYADCHDRSFYLELHYKHLRTCPRKEQALQANCKNPLLS